MSRNVLLVSLCLSVVSLSVVAQDTTTFTEDVEAQPLDGWTLEGASIQNVGQGSALVFGGPGVAFTPATCGQRFTLTFRARFQKGTGNITFCISGDAGQLSEYQLILNPEEIALTRHGDGASQTLGAGRTPQGGRGWVQVGITRNEGQLQIDLDGQALVTAQDANPLPGGGLAFCCHGGSGVAIDDVTLSGGFGQVAQPAIPINIPGMVKPDQEPAGQPPTQVEIAPGAFDDVIPQPIAPHVAQRMARPVTRAEMVQALLADPRTAQELRNVPGLGNRPPQELASTGLSGSPVITVHLAPGGGGAPPAGGAQLNLQKRIQAWEAGVTFSPATVRVTRKIGGTDLWMGILKVGAVALFQDLGDLLAANSVPIYPVGGPKGITGLAKVGLWLPVGQASYMVAVRIGDYDGSPASWVAGNPPIVKLRTRNQPPIQLVPLPDGSGYVGMCTIDARFDAVKTGGISDVMTQNNGSIDLYIDLTQNATQQVPYNDVPTSYVWFGGFTITRL